VGHVDRAWGYSFSWPQAGRQTEVYRSCLTRLLNGYPIGSAFEYFNERYAELSTELAGVLEGIEFGRMPDDFAVSSLWTANNDARGFAIIGDPAVRLPLANGSSGEPGEDSRVASGRRPPTLRSGAPELAQEGAEGDDGPDLRLTAARDQLVVALDVIAETLCGMVQRIVDDLPVLEIATYASADPSAARFDLESRNFSSAELRLLTRVAFDGSTSHVVGPLRGADDEPLWNLHVRMVEQARAPLGRSSYERWRRRFAAPGMP